jgi:hypothetical protein
MSKDDEILNEFDLKGIRDKFMGTFGLKGKDEIQAEKDTAALIRGLNNSWKQYTTSVGKKVKPTMSNLYQFLRSERVSDDTILRAAKKAGLPRPRIAKPKAAPKVTNQPQSSTSEDKNGAVPAEDNQ